MQSERSLLTSDEFARIAETGRLRAQDLAVQIAAELCPGPASEAYSQAVMWALTSGLATAAGNGLAALVKLNPDFATKGLAGLQGQLTSAYQQSMLMRSAVND